jgi:acetyltransferase-like isoleucine patch superfamily enzyme
VDGVFVHPKGLCESDEVGPGTRVWAFAHILKGARVGAGCNVCDHAFIEGGAIIGDRVTVKNAVLIWDGVTVEDEVFLGPNMVFTNDLTPRAAVRKGPGELLPTVVRRGATIGANATVVCGLEIGAHAFVAAGAVVTRDVARHALVAGNPAQRIGWVCACGRRLKDSTGHDAPAERERYAIDTNLVCESCGRHYAYVPDGETLEERTGPRQGAPA